MRLRKLWAFLLISCFSASPSLKCETITLAYSLENYDLSRYFAEFTAKTGIDVEFAKLTTSGMKTEILLRADAQSLPDAMIVPGDLLGLEVAQFGNIPDDWLSPEVNGKTRIHGIVLGQQKGVPIIAGNHLVLYFNKTLVSGPPANWAELMRSNETSNIPGVISWSYNEMFWLIPFLGAFDAYPYRDSAIRLNTPQTRKALQFYKSLADEQLVDANCNYQCAFDEFVQEKVAYTINGSWSLGGFREKLKSKLGVAMLPDVGTKKMRPYSSVHALAFPNNASLSDKKSALKQLSLFFQTYAVQQQMWRDIKALPVNNRLLQDIKASASENTKNLLTQLEASEPMPNDPDMSIVWEALVMGFNRFQGGAMDIDQAMEYMQYIAERSRDESR